MGAKIGQLQHPLGFKAPGVVTSGSSASASTSVAAGGKDVDVEPVSVMDDKSNMRRSMSLNVHGGYEGESMQAIATTEKAEAKHEAEDKEEQRVRDLTPLTPAGGVVVTAAELRLRDRDLVRAEDLVLGRLPRAQSLISL